MREQFISIFTILSKPAVAIGGSLVITALLVGAALQMNTTKPSGQYTAAIIAPIVAAGGGSSDLSFQVSGQIVSIPVSIGQDVEMGTVLVALDQSLLRATRAGAVANLEAAQARLGGLQSGARSEDIALYTQKYADASSALSIAMNNAYLQTESAVFRYADTLFSNGVLKVKTQSWDEERSIEMDRIIVGEKLEKWKTVLTNLNASSDVKTLGDARLVGRDTISFVSSFLGRLDTIVRNLNTGSGLSQTDIDTYRTTINTTAQMVSSGASAEQNAYAAWTSASLSLISEQSGSKPEDVAAQKAAVDAAQASLDGFDVSLRQATLVTPLKGTITALNAHLGQTVAPGQIIASIEAKGGSKQNALVVPKSAVIGDAGQAFVYIKSAVGVPVKTLVTTGLVSAQGMIEITSGLGTGQEVLTFGTTIKQ